MMKRFAHIVLFCWATLVYGQELTTVLSDDEVLIGQTFRLTYAVQSKVPFEDIVYSSQQGVLSGQYMVGEEVKTYELEIVQAFEDTMYQEGDVFIWKGWYDLVAWDSALVILSPDQVSMADSVLFFPPKLLSVNFPDANPSIELYDIHETLTPIDPDKSMLWWYILGIIILIIIGIVLLKRKKRMIQEIPISLLERTVQAIDSLEASKKYEESQKEYYYELSLILRRFLAELYQLRLMEKTSGEIKIALKAHGIKPTTLDLILQILNQSDLVKFAKHTPPISDVFTITEQTRAIVHELNAVVNEENTDG